MKDKIQKSLDEVIGKEIETLSESDLTPEQKEKTIENLGNLYKLRIEEAKIEQAKNDKSDDLDMKQVQLKEQAKDRWINLGLQIAQVALTIGSWGMFTMWQRREQRFEMEGTPTTPMFRNILSKMTPNLRK